MIVINSALAGVVATTLAVVLGSANAAAITGQTVDVTAGDISGGTAQKAMPMPADATANFSATWKPAAASPITGFKWDISNLVPMGYTDPSVWMTVRYSTGETNWTTLQTYQNIADNYLLRRRNVA